MGFTWTIAVTGNAVVSYTAFPPLPVKQAVYFCCTILGVTSTRRYLASCPAKPGLSSPAAFRQLQPRSPVLLASMYYIIFFLKRKNFFTLIILIFCSFKYHSEYLYTKFIFRSYSNKTASIHNLTILIWLLSYYFNNNIKNLMVRHLN